MLLGQFAVARDATPDASPVTSPVTSTDGAPVLLFTSDGTRPDLVEKCSADGVTPTFASMIEGGVTAENGLLQAFPPNTGTGWATLSTGTGPGEHGSINNTFYRTGDSDFDNRTSAYEPGVLQAQTIAQAAEQYGKTVAAVHWTGTSGLDPALSGPAIDYWSSYSFATVLANYELGASSSYQNAALAKATDWVNAPESFSPGLEQQMVIDTNDGAVNPERPFDLYIYDSTDDGTVNYDRLMVAPGAITTAANEAAIPGATPDATSDDSPQARGTGTRDGSTALADLAVGDWQDVNVTPAGEMNGLTAGFHLKMIDLSPDPSSFRVYATAIARANATYNGCDYAEGCAEKGLMVIDATDAYLDVIMGDLGINPDHLMVGAPVTDEFSHQFLGLITQTGPGGTANPRFDDADNDGQPDGLVTLTRVTSSLRTQSLTPCSPTR